MGLLGSVTGAATGAVNNAVGGAMSAANRAANNAIGMAQGAANSAVNKAQTAVNSAVGAAMEQANAVKGQLSSALSSALPGVDAAGALSGALGGALGGLGGDLTASFNSALSDVRKAANEIMAQGENLLGSAISSVAGSVPAAETLFGAVLGDTSALTDVASSAAKGLKEVDDKIKSISSDTGGAIAEAVSFVSKPVASAVGGNNTLPENSQQTDLLAGLTGGAVGDIIKATGSSLGSNTDVMDVLGSVTSEINDSLKGATDLVGSVGGLVGGLIGGTSSSLMSGIGATLGNSDLNIGGILGDALDGLSGVGGTVSSVFDATGDMTSEVMNSLPSSLKQYVNNVNIDNIASVVTQASSAIAKTATDIGGLLSSVTSSEDILGRLQKLGSMGYTYPANSNDEGGDLSYLTGGNSEKVIKEVYDAAMEICENIEIPEIHQYGEEKDHFDILLDISAELGLTDLLKQLKDCAGNLMDLFDERSIEILRESAHNAAQNGKIFVYETILDMIGSVNLADVGNDILKMVSNMSQEPAQVDSLNNVVTQLGFKDVTEVAQTQVGGTAVLQADRIGMMTATGTNVIGGVLGSEQCALIQSALINYA